MTNLIVTAYCACRLCCGAHADGLTAIGLKPIEGVTIAGPRAVPFGTRVFVPGLGVRIVQDRLARRYEGRWDVFFRRHQDAQRWGV